MRELLATLDGVPLAGLMLAITLGYALGRVPLRRVTLGAAGGTLFVSLLLGHMGLSGTGSTSGTVSLGTLGFALFIYSVGFDAAPHFFASFKEKRGYRFVAVGVVVNVLAVIIAFVVSRLLDLDASTAAGMLAGALTSAPTYAAASEVAPDSVHLSVAFALTYPFGLVGLVLAVQLLPRLFGESLSEDAATDHELSLTDDERNPVILQGGSPTVTRAFEVEEEGVLGRSLRDLDLTRKTGSVISRLLRGDDMEVATGATTLERGDIVVVSGRVDELRLFEQLVGPEQHDAELLRPRLPSRRIQVRSPEVVGKSLSELRLIDRHRCIITKVERGRLWMEPDADVTLVRDDVVEIVGRRDDVRAAARRLGRFEPSFKETDIAVYAGGIVLGLLLGALSVPVPGGQLSLGSAGGLLVVGLLLGWQQRLGPFRTHVPPEARQLVRDLGILLFVGETGLAAGAGLAAGLQVTPMEVFLGGIAVNVFTVLGSLWVARKMLGLRPLDGWGSVCGGLTSSAALHAVRQAADSNEAAIPYAAAYAIASVMATVAGPLLVLLLS